MPKTVLVIGLTPTVQRTLFFDRFQVGEVNRATQTLTTASGKGTNVARVIHLLGGSVSLLQIAGGDAGRFLVQTLTADGIPHETLWSENDTLTRTCTTLLSRDGTPTTELVEEAAPVSENDLPRIENAVTAQLQNPEIVAVCCSGSLPKGVPVTFYARCITQARERGIPVLVDAQKAPLEAALKERPFLVKPNLEEACATLNLTRTEDANADTERALVGLLKAGAENALISRGAAGSVLGTASGERFRIHSPHVEVLNPIGSGDSLAAGTLYTYFGENLSLVEAVRYGTACAAANCLSATSGVLQKEDVQHFLPDVRIV